MGFLQGKKLLITGIISNRSIAYGIAKACYREGAELAFSYAGERSAERIQKFAAEFGSSICLHMDVTSDEQIEACAQALKDTWGCLDGFVHSIGFAPREAIAGDFLDGISRSAFATAMDISAYSYPAMAKAFLPLMEGRKASLLALTYLGSERTVPNYNTMGLAKAALESSTRY
jgi:enoyl-[acyl-carrier protein] reductase I